MFYLNFLQKCMWPIGISTCVFNSESSDNVSMLGWLLDIQCSNIKHKNTESFCFPANTHLSPLATWDTDSAKWSSGDSFKVLNHSATGWLSFFYTDGNREQRKCSSLCVNLSELGEIGRSLCSSC